MRNKKDRKKFGSFSILLEGEGKEIMHLRLEKSYNGSSAEVSQNWNTKKVVKMIQFFLVVANKMMPGYQLYRPKKYISFQE